VVWAARLMDYYEEFGIPHSASPDEIRRIHKSLVRILHPDQFQDPELKRLAEGQMKRVNEIFTLLLDPAGQVACGEPAPPRASWFRVPEWAGWAVAAVILLAWLVKSFSGSPPTAANAVPAAVPPPRIASRPAAPLAPVSSAVRKAPLRENGPRQPVVPSLSPSAEPGTPTLDPPPVLAVAPTAPIEIRKPPAPPPEPRSLAGSWFWVKPRAAPAEAGLYPPEYIEVVIAGTAGELHGRYRARYTVPDRAISPEVSFRFEGAGGEEAAQLKWTGEGGARGEVQLRLVAGDSLEVKWFATEFGRNPGLSSGTAVLVRRQEP